MKAYTKDILKTIGNGKKRFLALALISALGVCMMSGLTAACDDLRYTADKFFDRQNLFDIMIVSTMGLTEEDVEVLSHIEGIEEIEGTYSETVFTQVNGQKKQAAVKVISQKDINIPYLLEGEMPLRTDEILVTKSYMDDSGKKIGDTIQIEENIKTEEETSEEIQEEEDVVNSETKFELNLEKEYETEESSTTTWDTKDYAIEVEEDVETPNFLVTSYTITGVVIDATDINSNEGAVSFRSNSTTDYTFFVCPEAVSSDIFTAVYITLEGTDELECYSDEYEAEVDKFVSVLEEEIKADREEARYEAITSEAYEKVDDAENEVNDLLSDAETELLNAKATIEDGWSEYLDGKKEYENGTEELEKGERELLKAQRQLEQAERQLDDAETELESAWNELKAGELLVSSGLSALEEVEETLNASETRLEETQANIPQQFEASKKLVQTQITSVTLEIQNTQAKITQLEQEIAELKETITDLKQKENLEAEDSVQLLQCRMELTAKETTLEVQKQELAAKEQQLASYQEVLEDFDRQEQSAYEEVERSKTELAKERQSISEKKAQLLENQRELAEGRQQLEAAQAEFDTSKQTVSDGWTKLEEGWAEWEDAYATLSDGKEALEEGAAQLEDGKLEYEDGVKEYEEKRQEALDKLAEARQEIADLKMTTWYISTRAALSGYSNIKTDAQCIEAIGNAFPILFMIVAILISLTTISRMVEEDRGLIGTYKALGFTDREIRRKYVVYALLACILGGILGDILGFVVLPKIIFTVFGVMYQLPEYLLTFNLWYGIGSILLFVVGITGAAVVSCSSELSHMPAILMRPKAPKNGSRVFLERITPIWSKLSFLNKVTARNLFRYKKRLCMTLFGIAGCTSILLAGFTIRDTVTELMPSQYGGVYQFDVLLVADDNEKLMEYLDDDRVRAYINPMITSVKVVNEDGREESIQLIVVPDGVSLRGYIQLEDSKQEKITLEDGMVVSTINVAEVQGYDEGDIITLQNLNLDTVEVEVTDIAMNYLGNAIYMTEHTYHELYGEFEPNGAYVMLDKSVSDHEAYAQELALQDGILSANSMDGFLSNFDSVFRILNLVVTIVITLAAALAFVVLFTLSTTNISERERELATIKVLGFFDKEVHAYVNKETLILTSIGILLGMPLGKVFGIWLMSVLKMPSIYFADYLAPISYVYAGVIAMVFAFLVNSITDKSLDKINPVEALKSIE